MHKLKMFSPKNSNESTEKSIELEVKAIPPKNVVLLGERSLKKQFVDAIIPNQRVLGIDFHVYNNNDTRYCVFEYIDIAALEPTHPQYSYTRNAQRCLREADIIILLGNDQATIDKLRFTWNQEAVTTIWNNWNTAGKNNNPSLRNKSVVSFNTQENSIAEAKSWFDNTVLELGTQQARKPAMGGGMSS